MRRSWLVMLGLGSGVYINVGGQLYVTECVVIVGFFIGVYRSRAPEVLRELHLPLNLLLLWLCATVVSDSVNGTPRADALRAMAAIGLLAATAFALACLLTSVADARLLLWSSAFGQVLGYLLTPTQEMTTNAWKYGLALAAVFALSALLITCSSRLASGLLLGFAALNIALGFRSLALIATVAATVFLLQSLATRRQPRLYRRGSRLIGVLGILGAAVGIDTAYSSLARSGALGVRAQQIFIQQGEGKFLLLSARPEMIFAFEAFIKHPIFGIGSSTPALGPVLSASAEILADLRIPLSQVSYVPGVLPLHSALPAALAAAGIGAPWFWVWFVKKCFEALLSAACSILAAPVVFLATLGLWNTFFSPFANTSRYVTALTISIILLRRTHDDHRASHDFDESGRIHQNVCGQYRASTTRARPAPNS